MTPQNRAMQEGRNESLLIKTPAIPIMNIAPDVSSSAVGIDATLLEISDWLVCNEIVVASIGCLLLHVIDVQRFIVRVSEERLSRRG
jgi:hypothetical protein